MLNPYLTIATARSVFLTPSFSAANGLHEATGLIAAACDRASLPWLSQQLRSEDPLARAEALRGLAASPNLVQNIEARFSDADRSVLQAQTERFRNLSRGVGFQGLKIVFLGDIHDGWGPVRRIVNHECRTGNEIVLGVGDLETYKGVPQKIPFLFCHGNHEDPAEIARIRNRPEPELGKPYPLFAGDFALLQGGLAVGAFSGIENAEYFDSGASGQFPFFSKADVARTVAIPLSLDIFLSHEAPSGVGLTRDGRDLGSRVVREVLEKLQPKVAFFGHHHREGFEGRLGRTQVIGLDYPKLSYVTATLDEANGELHFERHRAKAFENGANTVYQYDWEKGEEGKEGRLFSIGMPTLMSREDEISEMLNRDYRKKLAERLSPVLLPTVGKPDDTDRTKQLLAEGLANGLFNTILPYFARYYASLKATLSQKEREALKKDALRHMLRDKAAVAAMHNDLILAFNELASLVETA